MTEDEMNGIFSAADKQREIEQYILTFLYDRAKKMKCYCTWLLQYPVYDKTVGFEFNLEITSEDKKHVVKKKFYVDYEWKKEKEILKEIVFYLLHLLVEKSNQEEV